MNSFNVTPEYVSQSATACGTTAGQVQEDLATLQQYIINMEDWWHGIASNTFQDLMTDYSKYAAELYNALTEIGVGLQTNYGNYTDTETTNNTSITSIQSGLGSTNLS